MDSSDRVGERRGRPVAASLDNEVSSVLSIANPIMEKNYDPVNEEINSIKLDLDNLMMLVTLSNKRSTKQKLFNLMVKLENVNKLANEKQKQDIINLMAELQFCHQQIGVPRCLDNSNHDNVETTFDVETLDQSGDLTGSTNADSGDFVNMDQSDSMENVPATSSTNEAQPNAPDSALQLLLKDAEGKFHLDKEALNKIISNVMDCNLVTLLVTGAFTRGKAILLNSFLRYLNAGGGQDWITSDQGFSGFPCEIDSLEPGIFMWSKPFLINDNTAVLVMNTHGSFDIAENIVLFSLSTMVSSVLICNLHERIQMEDSENLKFLLEFGQLMQHDCNYKIFQKLVLVARDWTLFANTPTYGYLGGEELLAQLFQGRAGQGMSEMIQTCYEEIKFCLLPHPSEAVLNNRQFSGALSELSPVFAEEVRTFVESIFDSSQTITKKIGNFSVSGAVFAEYFNTFVEHLQSQNCLNPEALFHAVSRTCKELARKKVLSVYGEKMEKQLKSTDDVTALHQSLRKEAMKHWNTLNLIGGNIDADTQRDLLSQEIENQYAIISDLVEEQRKMTKAHVEKTKQKIKESYSKNMDNFCTDQRVGDLLEFAHELASSQALEHLELINDGTTAFKKHMESVKQIINDRWFIYKSRNDVLSKLNDQEVKSMTVLLQDTLLSYKKEMLESCDYKTSTKEFECHHLQLLDTFILSFEQKAKNHISLDRVKEFVDHLKKELKVLFEDLEEIHAKKISVARAKENKRPKGNYAIGIDLGTTHCCIAVFKDNKVEVIRNDIRSTVTPSVVYFGETQQIFGYAATYLGADHPLNYVSEMKRVIGRKFDDPTVQRLKPRFCFDLKQDKNGWPVVSVQNGEKKNWTPQEISGLILSELRYIASIHLDSEVYDAVVTIPCFFNELQREATKEACTLAGLNLLRIINEPTAAAIAYGIQKHSEKARNVVIFDFGGGTCDVSILRFENDMYTVLASFGDNELGGEDFDDLLMDYLVQEFGKTHPNISFSTIEKRRLRMQCESAKKFLSEHSSTIVNVVYPSRNNFTLQHTVTRELYHSLTAHLFPLILNPVNKCLKEAQLDAKEIDEVVLVGGSSKFRDVQILLKEKFPDARVHMDINPDEAIAYGAAIQAAISSGQYHKKPPFVKDITPFSLGIEENDKFFEILIPKNTPLPANRTKEFCTTKNNQSVAQFVVYQGENQIAKQNTLLGSFELKNIRRARAEQTKFDVTFTMDNDGILTVSAKEIGTENSKQIIINRSA